MGCMDRAEEIMGRDQVILKSTEHFNSMIFCILAEAKFWDKASVFIEEMQANGCETECDHIPNSH
ncbi:hypothetical protein AXF42_Ash020207 [Apostasia shenzhenica]|uniref:Pentatricopeptide repeat-containing protein n=1 Tax=Apostasia shenzhenica TaxID=1088818 RepID=A0A2H9ZWZ3_9ASPA|nr:hypothetical protein AXF42_Ash020207 [Apostasia shenzhenica]